MRTFKFVTAFASFIAVSAAASAEHHKDREVTQPKLVVAIAVDQFSSDLFSEYRATFNAGLKRMSEGAVFPAGYQSHAATETCPGHATIMTGAHPGRAGIIANSWIDLDLARQDKTVYCAEDERISGTSFGDITAATQGNYVASAWHLLVPTLGERLKLVSPASRNVAVAGKDRAALMMGGKDVDAIYWFKGKGFVTKKGAAIPSAVTAVNAKIAAQIDKARAPSAIPTHCGARANKINHGDGKSVGDYAFGRPDGGGRIFRLSPDYDRAIVASALAVTDSMKLGQGEATDILSIGLSATDYIGHAFGTEGLEMCIQMAELDRTLGVLFSALDEKNIDYVAMLTADHGGLDLPERANLQGAVNAQRIDSNLNAKVIGAKISAELNIEIDEPLVHADSPFGDYYLSKKLSKEQHVAVKHAAMVHFEQHPQVHSVIDREALIKAAFPQGSVDEWTVFERVRASYHADRSGDFLVLLNKGVTPIANTARGYVATHGSPWDYDRRVPILFWRKGMQNFEQPLPVQTVDIAPTLGALIGLEWKALDGRCLDVDGGVANSCD